MVVLGFLGVRRRWQQADERGQRPGRRHHRSNPAGSPVGGRWGPAALARSWVGAVAGAALAVPVYGMQHRNGDRAFYQTVSYPFAARFQRRP